MLTPGTCDTKELSHQRAFTPGSLWHLGHNCAFHQNIFTPGFAFAWQQGALTAENVYSRNHFRPRAPTPLAYFTPKSFPLEDVAPQSVTLDCKTQTHYTDLRHRAPVLPWIAKLTQTSATLDCKTHQNAVDYAQRDPALQKPFLSLFPVPSVGKILVITISALTSWSLMVFTLLSSSLERTAKYSTCRFTK